ncbi:aspartyl protease family protein [Sphingomonas sp. CJ20]
MLLPALLFSLSSALVAQQLPSEALRYDDRGRPMVAIQVNGQGPFDMVLDTGAQSSLMAPALADRLGLRPMASDLQINGATGADAASIYPIDRFSNGLIDESQIGLLRFPNPQSTSALGIIGMETFTGRRLVFDRVAHRVTAAASGTAAPGFVSLSGTLGQDGLLLVPILINGVKMRALVDTGAAVTVANTAALHALGWADDDARLRQSGQIRGATATGQGVRTAKMETLTIGPATLRQVPIYFTGAQDGDASPAIILGADILNLFEAFALDFPRAELLIKIPGKDAPAAVSR